MKTIELTQGRVALVDDEDHEALSQFNWCATNCNGWWAAMRKDGSSTVYMHRVITNAVDGLDVDHINGDALDNRKSNLRVVSHRVNLQNTHMHRGGKLPGVWYDKTRNKYRAALRIEGKTKMVGRYNSAIEAHDAYMMACKEVNYV